MDEARTRLFPLYASQLTPWWLRSLGARVGRDVEASTVVLVPQLTDIRSGAFLADDTLVGGYELGGGWLRTGVSTIGKRAFLGNSAIVAPGRVLAKRSLVAVQSATPKKARPNTTWWGSPPQRLRRVAATDTVAAGLTYQPGTGMKFARGCIESLRVLAIVTTGVVAGIAGGGLLAAYLVGGPWAMFALGGLVYMAAGVCAVGSAVVAKWVCVGRHVANQHPLYSPFVWLNELQDCFIEYVAAPWFFNHAVGTGEHNLVLRALGAAIDPGAWVETYWLPETDLCVIGAGATVGPGTVVQTHLFHHRIMSLDEVRLSAGASLGAHSMVLPAARIGRGASVGVGSLVMRGDHVPAGTRWQGNPIEPVESDEA